MEQRPEWTTKYRLFANHGQAMDVIADKLSQECGLTLRAIPVWMGSGRTGYAMVSLMVQWVRGSSHMRTLKA